MNATVRCLFLRLLPLMAPLALPAQEHCDNLIPNPSFEDCSVPTGYDQIGRARHWSMPTAGTSDLFHADAPSTTSYPVSIPTNWNGRQGTPWGRAYAGLFAFADNDNPDAAEYLQVRLDRSLAAGVTYDFSMYVSLADASGYAANRLGAWFTSQAVSSTTGSSLPANPQVVHGGAPITNKLGWTRIAGSFVASGGEQYLTIGRFGTPTTVTVQGSRALAYYYVDNLSLRQSNRGPICVSVGPRHVDLTVGSPWSAAIGFVDLDGDPLTLTVDGWHPPGLTVQHAGEGTANASVGLSWTPAPIDGGQQFFVGATARDCFGASVRRDLVLRVLPPPCAPRPPGMVGWWRDYSGQDHARNHDGAWSNPAGYSVPFVGDAMVFGSQRTLTVPDSPTLGYHGPANPGEVVELSVDAWINPSTTTVKRSIASHVGNLYWGFDFFVQDGRLGLALTAGPARHAFYFQAQHAALPTDRWTMVAVTAVVPTVLCRGGCRPSDIEFWVNGQLVPTVEGPVYPNFVPLNNPADLFIGTSTLPGTAGVPNRPFEGAMDEVELFHRILQPAEIQALYAAGASGKCSPTGPPVGWQASAARLGAPWTAQVSSGSLPSAIAGLIAGSRLDRTWVPGFGAFGIDLLTGPVLVLGTSILDGSGDATFTVSIPNHSHLADGPPLFVQPVIIDAGGLVMGDVQRLQVRASDSFASFDHGGWIPVGHTAVALSADPGSPERRVLIAGGCDRATVSDEPVMFRTRSTLDACLFDPTAQHHSPLPPMRVARTQHEAVRLDDGRVLLIGGFDEDSSATNRCEVFDPAQQRFFEVAPMNLPRAGHRATVLPDGRVLVTGGCTGREVQSVADILASITNRAELFDPTAGTWTEIAPMIVPRFAHAQTLLADGSVLITGGIEDDGPSVSGPLVPVQPVVTGICERFAGDAIELAGTMVTPTAGHGQSLLPDGRVLIVGGFETGTHFEATARCETWDPATGATALTGSLPAPVAEQAQIALDDGRALVVGGRDPGSSARVVGRHDGMTFTPFAGANHTLPQDDRRGARAVRLHNGTVLLSGGLEQGRTDLDWIFVPGL